MTEKPAIFETFKWAVPYRRDEWVIDCFGSRVRASTGAGEWDPEEWFSPQSDLFEWEALFKAIHNARANFTMIELGCGFARWLLFAAGALRMNRPELKPVLIGVEADTTHYAWALQTAADNGVEMRLIEAAVGPTETEDDFLSLEYPQRNYGSQLVYPWSESYCAEHGMPYHIVKTKVITLSSILGELEYVDLIDADIQGAEADVFEEAADELHRKVGSVFIETHGKPLEDRLRSVFARLGWRCEHSYHPYVQNDTPYGRMQFQGGVLIYRNPRFMPWAKQ